MQQRLDNRAPDRIHGGRFRRLAGAERTEALQLIDPVARGLAEENRRADCCSPEPVRSPKKRGQCLAQLLRAKRLGREQ